MDQRLRVLDPPNARHHGKDMGQKQIARMVAPVVIIGPAYIELKEMPEIQAFAKLPKKNQAPKPGHGLGVEGKNEFLGPSAHASKFYHKGRTLRSPDYHR